jgi:hypothetical protein
VAGELEGDHPVTGGERLDDVDPVGRGAGEAVDEDDRRPVAPRERAEAGGGDEVLIKPRQARCGRHPRQGILGPSWSSSGGGPVDPRQHDERREGPTARRAPAGFFDGRRRTRMANHLTPEQLSKELNMDREAIIKLCIEEGVPIYHGKIDKFLFQAQLAAVGAASQQSQ